MILTVTPNVALDITYRVDQLTPGSSHRVRRIEERAGGKGRQRRRRPPHAGHLETRAAAAGADIVKPNAGELLDTTGVSDVAAAATELRRRGAKAVFVPQILLEERHAFGLDR